MLFRSFLCLTLVAATAATTCYISDKKATNGGCPETTFKYGSCASKAVADAGVDALITSHKALAPADNAACKAKIDAQCAGVKAKGSDCAAYCPILPTVTGCMTDSDCTSTTTVPTPLACCSSLKTVYSNFCEYPSATLDAVIAGLKTGGGCADTNCVSTTSGAMGSAPMSFAMLLLAVVASLTASKI
ncbi:hypothetical protein GUITHDRAFT_117850 [Guillardia theta CCMP2712]|uniref:Uncharacterized protein n=1 Tax=Guillardia theta (strain CCMP2712) TaxID=905079 RepID=L1II61_GUITC|nr:hypothetical protein GUITHDRAFT_117850 [Guillardia theta CCMP2712]EKX35938.1 hypothetical protein GUITHDRAFT_117850 [Guillardia theta CCMP2712]|eukprot:XP_005822918.1 hypothetical protein GUITHDRAFT_117850 [Guillardia theta CCMP2712]